MKRWFLGLLLAAAPAAADDEVKLRNGDRLSGKVATLAKGKLVLATPHSGAVPIDWAQVVSVRTDGKVEVKLSTGEVIQGKLSPGPEGRLRIEVEGAPEPVEVALADGARAVASLPNPGSGGPPAPVRGTAVTVSWRPEDAVLLEPE